MDLAPSSVEFRAALVLRVFSVVHLALTVNEGLDLVLLFCRLASLWSVLTVLFFFVGMFALASVPEISIRAQFGESPGFCVLLVN